MVKNAADAFVLSEGPTGRSRRAVTSSQVQAPFDYALTLSAQGEREGLRMRRKSLRLTSHD